MLVSGVCLLVVSGFLLLVSSIVDAATSGSAFACASTLGSSPCVSPVVEYVFFVPALALLAIGVVLLVLVFLDIR